MTQNASGSMAREIMAEFADSTGLTGKETPRRYLWTDAFAACNYLELFRQTSDDRHKDLALRLVDQVHHILGRHRQDDGRSGWISGLDEQEGEAHPTKGGLRIGKKLNERKPGDPFDERLEWDRDGQYYHYLTKWMHALSRVSRIARNSTYILWAIELAKTAHARFTYAPRPSPGRQKRMYWKMSIDLSYPLVPSMGHHDPLDGFITYNELQAAAPRGAGRSTWPDLDAEISDMAGICEGKSWATDDPLGLGGLLSDAYRLAQLIADENLQQNDLLGVLLDASRLGLESFTRRGTLRLPVHHRLAFRELGLSIGLRAVERLRGLIEEKPGIFGGYPQLHVRIETLMRYAPLIGEIETFWLKDANRSASSWTAHCDINMVMLATSLAPDGYLALF